MNLVQINERLKDLPMQVIQQYANGMNPEVPPYLALGELQRREASQKQMATAQGGQQGAQPSIKEQMEQKAGLMQAQQMQQQQVAQQMQQPRGPMPAPAGVPQPEAQPEAMMARGGLAGIPVRRDMFEYAGGGIIAFAGGGGVKDQIESLVAARERYVKSGSDTSAIDQAIAALREKDVAQAPSQTPRMTPQQLEAFTRKQRYQLDTEGSGYNTNFPNAGKISDTAYFKDDDGKQNVTLRRDEMGRRLTDAEWSARKKERNAENIPTSQGPGDKITPRYPQGGLPAAAKNIADLEAASPNAAAASRPQPAAATPSGLPDALPKNQGASPYMAEAAELARQKPAAPTAAGIIAEQRALAPAAMQEEAMQKRIEDQKARATQERASFEKSRPSGLDDLIRVFGQAGQYKGLSGTGPAYTAMQQQKRAEESAMDKRQNELMTAIEGREYEGGKELHGARAKSMDAANKSYQDRIQTNTKTLADLAGVDQRRMDEAAQRLTQMQVAKLQAATAARPSEAERIEAKYMGMVAKGQVKEAEDYLNTISKIKGSGTAGVGAGRNAIMERRQTMAELKDIIKDEGMIYSEDEKRDAAKQYARLVKQNVSEGDGAGASTGKPITEAEYKKLPKGATYTAPDGSQRTKG